LLSSEVIEMTEADDAKARKKRQERLGSALFGVTLLGAGAYWLIVPSPGVAALELWRYWPIFLILAGLPSLLLPVDDGNRTRGLFLTGIGVFFQLQSLGVVSWTLHRAWPLILVAVGMLLLWRSQCQTSGSER
jgi:Domain of unknown function (DUF5668)